MKPTSPTEYHILASAALGTEEIMSEQESEIAEELVESGYGYWTDVDDEYVDFNLTDKGHLAYRVHKAFSATF